ncbi:MAG: serine/threonine protein kinase [Rubrivivax sp.]|nr:serine/threonine protein kinase [Rubrivivax sp.]
MSADADRWPRIRAEFERLVELPPPEREAALAALAALQTRADAHFVRELRSLLAHHESATGGALSGGAAAAMPSSTLAPAPAAPPDDRAGQRLGPWRIAARLGAGGMGDVWLATRDDGAYRSEAAIKVLRRGMDSAAVLARFAQEQQALAQLAHPHIARLLDAGRTADGLPYFVMERVSGQPIDRACAGLSLEARLQLFLQLADAVSHAHRRLLVHRDLKPSNVLVDDEGQVKLLDFGIAKALDPQEGYDGLTTVGGPRPFTPHYASPEQVRGDAVTTATDVYSLGVVLFQMLTGTRPTGRTATTPLQAARSVLDEEPTRPSRLRDSEAREPMWRTLRARVLGDLDNIVLKALEKVPERRYGSVDAMAADVQAFLDQRPVSARAASAGYVVARFVQRNRWAVVAGALGALGLVTGLVAAIVQGQAAVALGAVGMAAGLAIALVQVRQAARARDDAQARFEDLRRLAHHVLFDYHDLVEPLAGSTAVRQRLVSDAITYLDRMARAAPADRGVRLEVGMAYRTVGLVQRNGYSRPHLGDTAGAMRSFAQATAWLEPLVEEDERDDLAAYELALALSARAGVLAEDGRLAEAEPELLHAAALFGRHVEPDRPDLRHRLELARTFLRLASPHSMSGDADAALRFVGQARHHLERLAARQPDHAELPHVWVWVHGVATQTLRRIGDPPGMLREIEASQRIMDRLIGEQPDNARFQEDVAGLATWRLRAAGALGDLAGVREWGARAIERWSALAAHDPAERVARRGHLNSVITTGRELATNRAPQEALRHLGEATASVLAAMQRWPDDADTQARGVQLGEARACALALAGEHLAAEQALDEAQALAASLIERLPDEAPLLAVALAVRYLRARWLAETAVAAPMNAEVRTSALRSMQAVERERLDLIKCQRMPSRDYAWRLEEAPGWIERLQALAAE